jgi:hypothetical protein
MQQASHNKQGMAYADPCQLDCASMHTSLWPNSQACMRSSNCQEKATKVPCISEPNPHMGDVLLATKCTTHHRLHCTTTHDNSTTGMPLQWLLLNLVTWSLPASTLDSGPMVKPVVLLFHWQGYPPWFTTVQHVAAQQVTNLHHRGAPKFTAVNQTSPALFATVHHGSPHIPVALAVQFSAH